MSSQTTNFSRIERALNKLYPREENNLEHIAAWAEYYELLKDAEAYRNFWKPLNSNCPPDEWNNPVESEVDYFLFNGSEPVTVGYWVPTDKDPYTFSSVGGYYWLYRSETTGEEMGEHDYFTHYAEIPPLPKTQDGESS